MSSSYRCTRACLGLGLVLCFGTFSVLVCYVFMVASFFVCFLLDLPDIWMLYFAVKRFCEPRGQRRSWTVWYVCEFISLMYQ